MTYVVTPVSDYKETKEVRYQFDKSVVNNYDEAYVILSGMLFAIGNSTVLHDQIVNDIIVWGRKVDSIFFNKGRKVLALCVFIKQEHTMVLCERCMRERMENDSNGMVPASDLAITKMLKRGRGKKESPSLSDVRGRKRRRCLSESESESCTSVCLEEFDLARMCFMPTHCEAVERESLLSYLPL